MVELTAGTGPGNGPARSRSGALSADLPSQALRDAQGSTRRSEPRTAASRSSDAPGTAPESRQEPAQGPEPAPEAPRESPAPDEGSTGRRYVVPDALTRQVWDEIAGRTEPGRWHPVGTGRSKAVVLAGDGWIEIGTVVEVRVEDGAIHSILSCHASGSVDSSVGGLTRNFYARWAWALIGDDGEMVIPEGPPDPRPLAVRVNEESPLAHAARIRDEAIQEARTLRDELAAARSEADRLRDALTDVFQAGSPAEMLRVAQAALAVEP